MQDCAIYELEIQTPENQSKYKNSLFAVFDGHGSSYSLNKLVISVAS